MARNERRMFDRFEADYAAEIRRSLAEAASALCRDISAGGLGLLTDEPLIANTSFELELGIPDGHPPFKGTMRVVWSEQVQENKWRSGLAFKKADFMGIRRAFKMLAQSG